MSSSGDSPSHNPQFGTITRMVNDEPDDSYEMVYQELRAIAGGVLRRAGRTPRTIEDLGLTTVVHEAWLKLRKTNCWDSRAHFFGSAARAIRQILIDAAPKRGRSGQLTSDPADDTELPSSEALDVARRVHEALLELERVNPRCGRVAELKLFGDLSIAMISSLVGVSERTVAREWRFARVWLAERVGDGVI